MRSRLPQQLTAFACCVVMSMATAAAARGDPVITAIAPNNGPQSGGTIVTITGDGFIGGSTVTFGGASAPVLSRDLTKITAMSPVGSGLVHISVANSDGTSPSTPYDQYAYDSPPSGPWLGLNEQVEYASLGSLGDFAFRDVVYDREEVTAGQLPEKGDHLYRAIEEGHMLPVEVIGYKDHKPGCAADPEFPQLRTPKEEEEGRNSINQYVEGFIETATADLMAYPTTRIFFEPINEPWCHTTPLRYAAEYAAVIAELLPRAQAAGIPLSDIYVGAAHKSCLTNDEAECTENGWVPAMYAAQPSLQTEIQGWYVHPYGRPSIKEIEEHKCRLGVQCIENIQAMMTSGQNNIIASEVGFCTDDVNHGEGCEPEAEEHDTAENSTQAAGWMTEMLTSAARLHTLGSLKALLVFSRGFGGWAMQLAGGALTEQGEALTSFATRPYAETTSATSVSSAEATLHGIMNPDSLETSYYFEYGTTALYGTKTREVSAGAGTSNLEASEDITGLAADNTYHFRIVSTNSSGTAYGEDRTFATQPMCKGGADGQRGARDARRDHRWVPPPLVRSARERRMSPRQCPVHRPPGERHRRDRRRGRDH